MPIPATGVLLLLLMGSTAAWSSEPFSGSWFLPSGVSFGNWIINGFEHTNEQNWRDRPCLPK